MFGPQSSEVEKKKYINICVECQSKKRTLSNTDVKRKLLGCKA